MGFEFIKKLPTPDEIRNQYPIDAKIKALKEKRDQEIRDVFTGKSDKFLAIIGPCSADNEDAVCDYLLRLRKDLLVWELTMENLQKLGIW